VSVCECFAGTRTRPGKGRERAVISSVSDSGNSKYTIMNKERE
jgi:hypothetical protein